MTTAAQPTPEVRALLKEWCDMMRAQYGDDWKKIVTKQMADASRPYLEALLKR
jgi:hypothetical protein